MSTSSPPTTPVATCTCARAATTCRKSSAACAAAILEYFNGTGISVFADYRYYPNQVVYHKIMDALTRYGPETQSST